MIDFKKHFQKREQSALQKGKSGKKKWLKILLVVVGIFVIVGGVVAWKAGGLLNRISTNGNIFGSLGHMVPGADNKLQGEKDGRVNVMLLGMRGADDPAGGNLADSIMVVSLNLKDNKISMISIPRDLYVQDIQNDSKSKINAIYAQGYAKGGSAQALKDMEQKLISKALEKTQGNRTHAAKILGISIRTLRNKLNEYKRGFPAEVI